MRWQTYQWHVQPTGSMRWQRSFNLQAATNRIVPTYHIVPTTAETRHQWKLSAASAILVRLLGPLIIHFLQGRFKVTCMCWHSIGLLELYHDFLLDQASTARDGGILAQLDQLMEVRKCSFI
jgi:hypothetical protein